METGDQPAVRGTVAVTTPVAPPPPHRRQPAPVRHPTHFRYRFHFTMSSLCYPYGPGITCVCDDSGRIYKCFPELKSEQKAGRGGQAGDPSQGALEVFRGEQGDQGGDHLDRR